MRYHRPIPCAPGPDSLPIAGGWAHFDRVEVLRRDHPPETLPLARIAPEVLARLSSARAALCGLTMGGLTMDRPRIMGILNVTPDSFSDGGLFTDPLGAVNHARRMVTEGAEILDIGGESTRPGAAVVGIEDEIARTAPIIAAIRDLAPVSIDTRKARVAGAAVAAGAAMINDVSGLAFDPLMATEVARAGVPVCVMHAQGTPDVMQQDPRYGDVLLDVFDALAAMIGVARAAGVPQERIVVDPGIGFGKTQAHNLALLRRIGLFHDLGCPILLGVSRKRFIGTIGGAADAAARGPGTLAVTLAAVAQGVQIHRVHDVGMIAQGLRLWQALGDKAG
ncbi:dihydropteroate synthase [Paracoccus pacificus]|uniref:Dihydropteroate synthase n=1 Tax=Paracoccus pacificus TaxID=1463598 RepID=A0ABW4R2B2_9RHOB